ncbi:hypothetical protein prwr041_02580 [Prevotella herbatica]|uniref:DUF1566 domain-containing protein n=1 Tax=Prevotella herbatica TaxID=2801997 RepID=A0ABM7NV35_9BACT|nr:hypothetical protein prwr041_02580 [Prevotella herbatica]
MKLTFCISDGNQTRAITSANENIVSDITVMIFDASGSLIGSTYQPSVAAGSVSVPVTTRSASNCKIYAIANTGSSSYFAGVNTIDKLNAMYTTIGSPADLENNGSTAGSTGAMMIGHIDVPTIDPGTNQFAIPLYHQCGKVSFTITPVSGVTITGYQLCNVPLSSYITGSHVPASTSNVAGPPAGASSYGNFTAVSGLSQTTSLSKTYYVYENLCGSNSSVTDEKSRNSVNAPTSSSASASYLLVYAKSNSWTSTYRIYLGGVTNSSPTTTDLTNFNVYRNLNYQCGITLGTGGGSGDARVTYKATIVSGRNNMYLGDAPIGNYLYSDGTNGTTFQAGKTVGIIYSSEITQAQYDAGCRHGRVLALKNANGGNICLWSSVNNSPYTDHTSTGHLYATNFKTCFDDVSSGYDVLNYNPSYVNTSSNYAWYYCYTYNDGTVRTKTSPFINTGWYLLSAGELWDIIENLGTWSASQLTIIKGLRTSTLSIDNYLIAGLSGTYFDNLNTKLLNSGGDRIIPQSGAYYFWSASETDANDPVHVNFSSSFIHLHYGISKTSSYGSYVRAVLAY